VGTVLIGSPVGTSGPESSQKLDRTVMNSIRTTTAAQRQRRTWFSGAGQQGAFCSAGLRDARLA
jgi:hypothetical protein